MAQNATATVLVVDDHPQWRARVGRMLQRHPWKICEACDGEEAVERAAGLQPAVILLDITLPKLNGIEAARRIRESSPSSRIVFLTADGNKDIKEAALRIRGSRYVQKADAATQLVAAIVSALADRHTSAG